MSRQWNDAIHIKPDDFFTFWSHRLKSRRDILLIVGIGWDPRMPTMSRVLKKLGGEGIRYLHLIRYSPSKDFESPYKQFIERNMAELDNIREQWGDGKEIEIVTRNESNLYIGDDELSKAYVSINLEQFSDIIVDISSLPKSLYFTLLLILVKKAERQSNRINLNVVACQDSVLDNKIIETADDTRYLKGFKRGMTLLGQKEAPVIWVPLLARMNEISLKKLLEHVGPADIYPVLPFPSHNPRNDDDLLIEYGQIFVSEWRLNPMNIIYAAEDDPLDVYQSLTSLYQQQREALEPLGGISMVVSALSSKLSSIGAFMAACDLKIAVAHSIGRHNPVGEMDLTLWDPEQAECFEQSLYSIWLTGEPYEE